MEWGVFYQILSRIFTAWWVLELDILSNYSNELLWYVATNDPTIHDHLSVECGFIQDIIALSKVTAKKEFRDVLYNTKIQARFKLTALFLLFYPIIGIAAVFGNATE